MRRNLSDQTVVRTNHRVPLSLLLVSRKVSEDLFYAISPDMSVQFDLRSAYDSIENSVNHMPSWVLEYTRHMSLHIPQLYQKIKWFQRPAQMSLSDRIRSSVASFKSLRLLIVIVDADYHQHARIFEEIDCIGVQSWDSFQDKWFGLRSHVARFHLAGKSAQVEVQIHVREKKVVSP